MRRKKKEISMVIPSIALVAVMVVAVFVSGIGGQKANNIVIRAIAADNSRHTSYIDTNEPVIRVEGKESEGVQYSENSSKVAVATPHPAVAQTSSYVARTPKPTGDIDGVEREIIGELSPYIVNTKTGTIHYNDGSNCSTISKKSRMFFNNLEPAMIRGYTICGNCFIDGLEAAIEREEAGMFWNTEEKAEE